ncbi:MAG: TIGR03016 family PEP-CTERM system-associated outer membrane protein [Pseudomonadota bacterium]
MTTIPRPNSRRTQVLIGAPLTAFGLALAALAPYSYAQDVGTQPLQPLGTGLLAPEQTLDPGLGGSVVEPGSVSQNTVAVPQTGSGPLRLSGPLPQDATQVQQQAASAVRGPGITRVVGGWVATVVPYAEQSFTVSDNIDLDPAGEEQSDFVSSTTLGANIALTRDRVAIRGGVEGRFDKYVETDENDEFVQNGFVGVAAEVVRDRLFLDAAGRVQETVQDSDDRFSANPTAGSGDRERVYSGTISPSLRTPIGGWANAELRYTLSGNLYEDDTEDDEYTQLLSAAVLSKPPVLDGVSVGARAEFEDYTNEDSERDSERFTASTGVDVPVSPTLALTGTLGVDEISTNASFEDDIDGVFGNLGVRWQPNPRLAATAFLGYRYGGVDFGGSVNYLLRRNVALSASFGRSLELDNDTEAAPFLVSSGLVGGRTLFRTDDFTDGSAFDPNSPNLTGDINQAFAVNTATGEVGRIGDDDFTRLDETAIVDTAVMSLTGDTGRTRYRASARAQRRDFQSTRDDELLWGVDGAVEYDVATRWVVFADSSFQRSEESEPGTEDSDTLTLSVGAAYRITDNVNGFARYTYARRFSDASADRYEENAGTVGVRVRY